MKRPYFKLTLGAVFWLSATLILAALIISAAIVSTTLTSWPTDSTPFLEALWGTTYFNESAQGHLDALVFWFFLFAQYIAAIGLFISAARDHKKNKADTSEPQA